MLAEFIEVPLTKGYTTKVSPEDAWVLEFKWCARTAGPNHVYAARSREGRLIQMHREIIKPSPGLVVDHIDGDTLNNQRPNLRPLTHALNITNQRGGRGVWFVKAVSKWRAAIQVEGKTVHLGYFLDEEAALIARLHAEHEAGL